MIDLPAPAVQGLQNTGICREGKDQTVGPQRLEFAVVAPVVPIPAVFSVPQQRVACCGELGADLVSASGHQLTLYQGQSVFHLKGPIKGHGGASAGDWMRVDRHLVPGLIFDDVALQLSGQRSHLSVDGAEVIFLDLPILYLLVHDAQGLCGLCSDNDAAGIAVNPVAESWCKGVFLFRIPLIFLV